MQSDVLLVAGIFVGIVQQVQHDLQQLIRITKRQWQRWIIILDDRHMRTKTQQGGPPRPIQNIVYVDRFQVGC